MIFYLSTSIYRKTFLRLSVLIEDGFEMIFSGPRGRGQIFGEVCFLAIPESRPFFVYGGWYVVNLFTAGNKMSGTRRWVF